MDKIIEDDELGRLVIRVNSRARSLVFRTKSDAVYVSVPPGTTLKEVKQAIENLRGKLLASRQKIARPLIDLNYKIDAEYFKLSLVSGEKEQFLANSRLGCMQIICPPNADFTDEKLQSWLRKVIEESLRRNAKSILPSRLASLSKQCGLPYSSVKINSSQGRWGSCSARKDINLCIAQSIYRRKSIGFAGGIEKVSYGDLEYFIARIVLSCWHTCVNTLAQS